jgi:hypothetical protein
MKTLVTTNQKPSAIQSKLVELMNVKESPSVSIILKKETPSTRHEEFQLAFKNAVKDAVTKLDTLDFPYKTIEHIKNELHDISEKLPLMDGFKTLAVFVSPHRTEVIYLPVEAVSKTVVDDNSFEVRDLLRAVNRTFQYDVLVLSKKNTRFFHGLDKDIMEVQENLPEGVDYYLETRVGDKNDPAKAETEAAKLYVHEVEHFIRQRTDLNAPLILMGDEKIISYFKNYTKRPKRILAEIHGSFSDSTLAEIQEKIVPQLSELIKKRDEQLLERIQHDIDGLNYAAGIQDCWTAAAMKEARILLVEQGYTLEGYSVQNGMFLTFSKPDEDFEYHADVIDDLAEMVLAQGGEVYFVQPGLLEKFDKVILTTRY